MQYSKIDKPIEVMRKTLEWRHLAPTCPDNVPCTPCLETDPFTMFTCPEIYFCGNCDVFATEMYKGMLNYYFYFEIGFLGIVGCTTLTMMTTDNNFYGSIGSIHLKKLMTFISLH